MMVKSNKRFGVINALISELATVRSQLSVGRREQRMLKADSGVVPKKRKGCAFNRYFLQILLKNTNLGHNVVVHPYVQTHIIPTNAL